MMPMNYHEWRRDARPMQVLKSVDRELHTNNCHCLPAEDLYATKHKCKNVLKNF